MWPINQIQFLFTCRWFQNSVCKDISKVLLLEWWQQCQVFQGRTHHILCRRVWCLRNGKLHSSKHGLRCYHNQTWLIELCDIICDQHIRDDDNSYEEEEFHWEGFWIAMFWGTAICFSTSRAHLQLTKSPYKRHRPGSEQIFWHAHRHHQLFSWNLWTMVNICCHTFLLQLIVDRFWKRQRSFGISN